MRRVSLIAAFVVCLLAVGPEAEAKKAKPSVEQVRGRLVIDPSGEILRHHVTWASDAVFADSALEAIDGRHYRPGRCAGEPVPVLSSFTFWFGSGR